MEFLYGKFAPLQSCCNKVGLIHSWDHEWSRSEWVMPALGEVEVIGDVLVVSWRGKILFGDEPSLFCREVRDRYPDFRCVVVNLAHAELLPGDVPALLVHYLTAYADGYRIRFCAASTNVSEVLDTMRVAEVFHVPIDKTEDESLAAFNGVFTPANHRARAETVA